MRVLLFGATGMVGQGILRECLRSPTVSEVLCIVRRGGSLAASGSPEKVRELVTNNIADLSPITPRFAGIDACFFALGVSAFRMSEPDYRRITFDLTLSAAHALLDANPGSAERPSPCTFVYVSGSGTNSASRTMWARVKGETENALLALPFRAAYMFRPGGIVPLHGIRSKTAVYQAVYSALGPALPLLLRTFPRHITTTEQVGRAMLHVARVGYPTHILEPADIAACGSATP